MPAVASGLAALELGFASAPGRWAAAVGSGGPILASVGPTSLGAGLPGRAWALGLGPRLAALGPARRRLRQKQRGQGGERECQDE